MLWYYGMTLCLIFEKRKAIFFHSVLLPFYSFLLSHFASFYLWNTIQQMGSSSCVTCNFWLFMFHFWKHISQNNHWKMKKNILFYFLSFSICLPFIFSFSPYFYLTSLFAIPYFLFLLRFCFNIFPFQFLFVHNLLHFLHLETLFYVPCCWDAWILLS